MADEVKLTESESQTIRALYPILVAQREAMNRAIDAMRQLDALNEASLAAQKACKEIIAGAERRAQLSVQHRGDEANG